MAIETRNPATGELIREFKAESEGEVSRKLDLAQKARKSLRELGVSKRAQIAERAAQILERDAEVLAALATLEMGKLLKAGIDEVKKCALACRYYAENGPRFLEPEVFSVPAGKASVRLDPIGPVLAVMPWNFPYWQVFRFAAPALLLGNPGLLKHSSNTPQCALAIEKVLLEAGMPEGGFQTLLIPGDRVAAVVQDPRIAAATLTGSERAGASLAQAAGASLKKVVLELGGSDPFIIFPSTNLEKAAQSAVEARMINSGQSCIAAKRFFVHEDIADRFERLFVARILSLKVGDPRDPSTEIGPLALRPLRDDLKIQVEKSVAAGAKLKQNQSILPKEGNWFMPAVLLDVPDSAPASGSEELFGPVAAVRRFSSIEEVLRFSNSSPYGLGASVWTEDPGEQERMIAGLENGSVFINSKVVSDPALPFGGVKQSGHGRELSRSGLREFANEKTVRTMRLSV